MTFGEWALKLMEDTDEDGPYSIAVDDEYLHDLDLSTPLGKYIVRLCKKAVPLSQEFANLSGEAVRSLWDSVNEAIMVAVAG